MRCARWLGEDLEFLLTQGRLHTYLMQPPQAGSPYDLDEGGGLKQVVEVRMKGPAGSSFLASISQAIVKDADGRVRTVIDRVLQPET